MPLFQEKKKGDREAKVKIIVSRIMTILEDVSPRGKMSSAFIVRK